MSERYDVSLTNWADDPSRPHLARYYIARGYLKENDMVLDAACGTGYGSELMSDACKHVTGMDYHQETINRAETRNIKNVLFLCRNLDDMEIPIYFNQQSMGYDVTVTFETLEHLKNPEHVADMFRKMTRRLIIFSVPIESEENQKLNIFHLNRFTESTIQDLICKDGWIMFHSFRQGPHYIGVAYKTYEPK